MTLSDLEYKGAMVGYCEFSCLLVDLYLMYLFVLFNFALPHDDEIKLYTITNFPMSAYLNYY